MNKDLEKRILSLAAHLGMFAPSVLVRPTTGPGSRSRRKGVEAGIGAQWWWMYGTEVDAAGAELLSSLVEYAKGQASSHWAKAAEHTRQAEQIESAIASAIGKEVCANVIIADRRNASDPNEARAAAKEIAS